MGRFLHDQALTITTTGGVDTGSGVVEYIIYALRATVKGAAAPSDSQGNYDSAIEIGRLGNLAETQGYSSYAPANTYDFKWYNWENGFAYRIWTMAVDKAGNIEIYDGSGNTYGTTVLLDSRPPQFIASYSGTRIPNNCVRKSDIQPWNATKSAASLYFLITIDNGEYPGWFTSPGTDNLANYWLVFNSAASSPTYTYFAQIQANDNNGGVQDRVQIYCNSTNPVYQLNNSTGEIVLITTIANVVDNAASEWASGAVVVLSRPILTCGIGTMTLEYEGVDSSVADLDHYKIERYVTNVNAPAHPGNYGMVLTELIEDTKYIDYNKIWAKSIVINWINGTSQYSDNKVYGRGLYKITPVDVFGNEGYPTLTFDYTNVTGFFPVTGTPPADIVNKQIASDDDGNITLEWDEPTDDDLRGYQIARRRGEYDGSGDDTLTSNYAFDSWELITEQDNDEFEAGSTYAKKYRDVNLEPFSTDLRPEKIAYQYRIRATDYSGNTALNWVDLPTTTTVTKAVDVTVNTTGSGLTAAPKIGSISLTVTQPTDNLSTKVHLYRSVGDNTSYEATPFKVVELAASGALSTQDEHPPVDAEMLIYYKQKFEDQWGNVSGFVNETSASSKTAASAGDSIAPLPPDRIAAYYDEPEAVARISFRRPNYQTLPGTVAVPSGTPNLTYTPSGDNLSDYFSSGESIQILDAYGDAIDRIFQITELPTADTATLSENVTSAVSAKSARHSVDYAGSVLFKRRRYADSTYGDWVVIKDIGSSQVDTAEDKALIVGEWQYGISAKDTFNNESAIADQDDEGFNLDILTAGINDIFIYNTANDTIAGTWKDDDTKSWYNETLNTSTRGSTKPFPEVAFLVATDSYLYIYDGSDGTMWMRFDSNSSANDHARDQGVNSLCALNGRVYAGLKAGYGFIRIDFVLDKTIFHTAANGYECIGTLSERNDATGRTVDASVPVIVNDYPNASHAAVLPDGKTYVVVGTDGGATGAASLINETDGVVYDIGTANKKAGVVRLARDGTAYIANNTDYQLEVFYLVHQLTGDDTTPDMTYDENSTPALFETAQTMYSTILSDTISDILVNVYNSAGLPIVVSLRVYNTLTEATLISPDGFISANNIIDFLKE